MNTWTPLFSKIVKSSLWSEPDHVRIVFITLMACKDADQVCRTTAYEIGKQCWGEGKEGELKALDALKILSSPDKRRVEPQPFEGRRIQKVEDGWLILNGQTYEEMMRKINRREYKRKKESEYRARRAKQEGIKGLYDRNINKLDLLKIHEQHAAELRRELEAESDGNGVPME